MLCGIATIHFLGGRARFFDALHYFGIVLFNVARKGRKRADNCIFVNRLAVKAPKPCRLGTSTYQEPDRHRHKTEMKMPAPNGGWHGH